MSKLLWKFVNSNVIIIFDNHFKKKPEIQPRDLKDSHLALILNRGSCTLYSSKQLLPEILTKGCRDLQWAH